MWASTDSTISIGCWRGTYLGSRAKLEMQQFNVGSKLCWRIDAPCSSQWSRHSRIAPQCSRPEWSPPPASHGAKSHRAGRHSRPTRWTRNLQGRTQCRVESVIWRARRNPANNSARIARPELTRTFATKVPLDLFGVFTRMHHAISVVCSFALPSSMGGLVHAQSGRAMQHHLGELGRLLGDGPRPAP